MEFARRTSVDRNVTAGALCLDRGAIVEKYAVIDTWLSPSSANDGPEGRVMEDLKWQPSRPRNQAMLFFG